MSFDLVICECHSVVGETAEDDGLSMDAGWCQCSSAHRAGGGLPGLVVCSGRGLCFVSCSYSLSWIGQALVVVSIGDY